MKVNPKEAPPGFYATQAPGGNCNDCEYIDESGACRDRQGTCIQGYRKDKADHVIYKKIKTEKEERAIKE